MKTRSTLSWTPSLAAAILTVGTAAASAQGQTTRPPVPDLPGMSGPVAEVPCPKGWIPIPEEDYQKSGMTRRNALQMRALKLSLGPVEELPRTGSRDDLPEEIRKDPTLLDVCETPAQHDSHSGIEAKQRQAEAKTKAEAASDMAGGAVPVVGKIAGGLVGRFGRRGPTPDAIANDLAAGRYEWRDLKFKKGATQLDAFKPESLQLLQEAFARTGGRFVVWVPAELDKGQPDTTLQGERTKAVLSMLLSAGIPADRLVAASDATRGVVSDKDRQPVKPGEARALLIRLPN